IAAAHSEGVEGLDRPRRELAQVPVAEGSCSVRGADGTGFIRAPLQEIRDGLRVHRASLPPHCGSASESFDRARPLDRPVREARWSDGPTNQRGRKSRMTNPFRSRKEPASVEIEAVRKERRYEQVAEQIQKLIAQGL